MAENCTYIDGIGSSTAIDTAGEIVDLAGLDCSSLVGGAFNWEHNSSVPASIVGKVLEYKKIFSDKDCENDRHKYYWEKCKTPFLYVMGRLFDDKKPSAKECAALFHDDAEHPQEHPMVGFSIEGSKVDKKGIVVNKSIARKVTITHVPANKTCLAEMIKSPEKKESPEDSIFKSEPSHKIDLVKTEPLKKAPVPGSKYPSAAAVQGKPKSSSGGIPKFGPIPTKPKPQSQQIGTTKSGKAILSHAKPHEYKGWSAADHQEAANIHMGHAEEGKGIPGATHFDTAKRHMALAGRNERHTAQKEASRQAAVTRPDMNVHRMNKAMSAGSGLAAPQALTQGAALAPESLDRKMKKKELLARAEQAYKAWEKREAFENFMAKTMPQMTKGEIMAIGQTLCLKKSLRAEKKLKKMMRDEGQDSWVKKKE